MAYSTTSSTAKKNLKRPSQASVDKGYSSALSGFTADLSAYRKKLLEEQVAAADYSIEVGSATVEDKISLYENYLSQLEQGTSEWYRVSNKIQDLQDQAGTEDFAIAKSLYAGNQISTEQYYGILKSRAAEANLSDKEKRIRTTELWEFEQKLQNQNTDTALRDSTINEDLGLITASDRLELLKKAYDAETDPERKQSLKGQIVTQSKKVYDENVSIRELTVRKGIQEGVNTKEDLLPIYAEKIQTATNAKDALQAEVSYQALVKDIQGDYETAFKKNSKEIKGLYNGRLGELDVKIKQAEKNGDVSALHLLYENKRFLIDEFLALPDNMVSAEDKQSAGSMFTFMKNIYGIDIDPETGTRIDTLPTDPMNIKTVDDALSNPDSSLLVRKESSDGQVSKYDLVRGDKVDIQMPDGTVKSYYDFGPKNIAVSRLDPTLTHQKIDPLTGQAMTDEKGNPILEPTLPVGREMKKLPEGYDTALQQGNVKPLGSAEFKGEFVDLYKDQNGNQVRGYVVYGNKFKDVLGAQPVEGKADTYILTTKDNAIPTQKYLAENKLYNPSPLTKTVLQAGVGLEKFSNLLPGAKATANVIKAVSNIPTKQDITEGVQSQFNAANLVSNAFKANKVANDLTNFKLPNFSEMTANVGAQIASSIFNAKAQNNLQSKVFETASKSVYKYATQQAANRVLENSGIAQTFNTGKNIISGIANFAGNAINKGLSFLGLGGK